MRVQATIVRYFPMCGFGFCRPDGSKLSNVFVHISDAGVLALHEGDRIECEIDSTERGLKAVRVKVLSFAG